ncbi:MULTISPECIES: EexN family lipoprotein [unclassified Bartonella]|uniref:EexN family lipoprotein n=1 Tax=unclassified Bartonella TaxID=2645622 RepID=UPI00235F9F49|nr:MULTISPECIES: EexN family lipoprotein [unclassified Bartonella]
MNKVFITTLLLCTGIITAGCEKIHSVEEFKKDEKLREEWTPKCMWKKPSKTESPQNCENLGKALDELGKESFQNYLNKYRNNDDKKKTEEQSEKQENSN